MVLFMRKETAGVWGMQIKLGLIFTFVNSASSWYLSEEQEETEFTAHIFAFKPEKWKFM